MKIALNYFIDQSLMNEFNDKIIEHYEHLKVFDCNRIDEYTQEVNNEIFYNLQDLTEYIYELTDKNFLFELHYKFLFDKTKENCLPNLHSNSKLIIGVYDKKEYKSYIIPYSDKYFYYLSEEKFKKFLDAKILSILNGEATPNEVITLDELSGLGIDEVMYGRLPAFTPYN